MPIKQIYQYCMSNFHYDYSTVPFLKPNLESGQNSQNWHNEMVRYIFFHDVFILLHMVNVEPHTQTNQKEKNKTNIQL